MPSEVCVTHSGCESWRLYIGGGSTGTTAPYSSNYGCSALVQNRVVRNTIVTVTFHHLI